MQKMKKIVSVLAAGTMLASMTAFSANAADEATIAQMQSTLDGMAVAQGEMSAGALAIAKTQEMLAEVNDTSEPFYYPYYSSYSTLNVSKTQHYLAAIPAYGKTLPVDGIGVYFYVNTNLLPDSPTARSNFRIGSGYAGGVKLNAITSQAQDGNCRRILAQFTKTGAVTATSELFTYKTGEIDDLGIVNSEMQFHHLTNTASAPNSLILSTNVVSDCTFRKCGYSLGDVNRDGQVTLDDSQGILSYLVHSAKPSRADSAGGYYDTIAFKLAADFDENGKIEIQDVVGINQYVGKNGE